MTLCQVSLEFENLILRSSIVRRDGIEQAVLKPYVTINCRCVLEHNMLVRSIVDERRNEAVLKDVPRSRSIEPDFALGTVVPSDCIQADHAFPEHVLGSTVELQGRATRTNHGRMTHASDVTVLEYVPLTADKDGRANGGRVIHAVVERNVLELARITRYVEQAGNPGRRGKLCNALPLADHGIRAHAYKVRVILGPRNGGRLVVRGRAGGVTRRQKNHDVILAGRTFVVRGQDGFHRAVEPIAARDGGLAGVAVVAQTGVDEIYVALGKQ